MDIDTHDPRENPDPVATDVVSADLENASGRDPIPALGAPSRRRITFNMPSAEAIADAIIRRASTDIRG